MLPESGGVVLLCGDLSSGKTTLVQTFVRSLGIDSCVTSPTFSLQHCYEDTVFHYDIYSKGVEHFISLGLLEELERDGYHFVEWADDKLAKLLQECGLITLLIEIEKSIEGSRHYRVSSYA